MIYNPEGDFHSPGIKKQRMKQRYPEFQYRRSKENKAFPGFLK
jgi:hypothetical protein